MPGFDESRTVDISPCEFQDGSRGANLSDADLPGADLSTPDWDEDTAWADPLDVCWPAWSPTTAKVAVLFSRFEPVPVVWAWVESASQTLAWDAAALEAARLDLYEQGVLHLTDQGCYTLDAEMRRFLRAQGGQAMPGHRLQRAVSGAIAHGAQQVVRTPSDWPMPEDAQFLVPHMVALVASGTASPENHQWCCVALGAVAQAQQQLSSAEQWYQQGLDRQGGMSAFIAHPARIHNLTHLARLYDRQGQYSAAHLLFDQAILAGRSLGADHHADLATSISALADLYKTEGRYAEAEAAYRQALNLRTQKLDNSHPDCARSLNDLAGLYSVQGQYDRAESLYREALRLNRAFRGNTDATVALGLKALTGIFYARKQYQAALQAAIEAAAIGAQTWGPDHGQTQAFQQSLHIIQRALEPWAKRLPSD
jgi:tetratricopeptide (TPR) repeat protein